MELFLIRWISTEIRIFAYVSNLVLLGCFIGLGSGCSLTSKKNNIFFSLAMLAVISLAIHSTTFGSITDLLAGFKDAIIWSPPSAPKVFDLVQGISLTLFLFVMIAAVFFPLGQLLGTQFKQHPDIVLAYSVNVLGSIAGVWLFSWSSVLGATPMVWLFICMVFALLFLERKKYFAPVAILLYIFSMIVVQPNIAVSGIVRWSPYQKLGLIGLVGEEKRGMVKLGYEILVNNTIYMKLLNLSPAFLDGVLDFSKTASSETLKLGQYDIAYTLKKDIGKVLIVGAGAGNDAAGALRNNARHIDAVEIDPRIYEIGKLYHPEQPYSDPKVRIHIDDARSFFKKTRQRYDLISFGLLDSHGLASNYTNTRLDNYVYTTESFKEAKALLAQGGMVTVTFATTTDWLTQRIRESLFSSFGHEPLMFLVSPYGKDLFGGGTIMFVVSNDMAALHKTIEDNKILRDYINRNIYAVGGEQVLLSRDDWPYLYLHKPRIPNIYLAIMASLAALFVFAGRAMFFRHKKIQLHFFFLGAAFMLLEFQNISKAGLLFGTTWVASAVMISAILLFILLANIFVNKVKVIKMPVIYGLLFFSLFMVYCLNLSSLNAYGYWFKAIGAALIMNIPIFFAGIIFIYSLRECSDKAIAFGSNMLGAGLGGVCEGLSFVFGIKAMVLFVAVLYVCAFLFKMAPDRVNGLIKPMAA
ncbi:MAG: hypothetical protein KBA46_06810 [Candidatus Omnitrophica bacterium]|nr:hypothetical protein [Candidatus Omnitrophota bacterium]